MPELGIHPIRLCGGIYRKGGAAYYKSITFGNIFYGGLHYSAVQIADTAEPDTAEPVHTEVLVYAVEADRIADYTGAVRADTGAVRALRPCRNSGRKLHFREAVRHNFYKPFYFLLFFVIFLVTQKNFNTDLHEMQIFFMKIQ